MLQVTEKFPLSTQNTTHNISLKLLQCFKVSMAQSLQQSNGFLGEGEESPDNFPLKDNIILYIENRLLKILNSIAHNQRDHRLRENSSGKN